MQRRSSAILLASLIAFCGDASLAWAVEANARSTAASSVTLDEVKRHVEVLADDTFEGREAGSRGNRAAGLYIIEALKKDGIAGGGPGGDYYQTGTQSNSILGIVPGSDPVLKDEVILVGAHYDHVGYGSARNSYGPLGYIHNGADDNASGVSAALEVAQAISLLPEMPKRTILFAFWDGEEKGLWGSKYWVENPTLPIDKLRVAINIDMIGRLRKDTVKIYGVRTAPGLRQLISRPNDGPLSIDFDWDVKGDSDHYSFFTRGIPFVMLHTGLHDDYHRPSDDADKINHEGLHEIARLLFGMVVELADAPSLGKFRTQSRMESQFVKRGIEVSLPAPPGRLGLRWNVQAATEGMIIVDSVVPGSAAEQGGLRAGDRILSFAGHEIRRAEDFRLAVLAAVSPAQVTIERSGESQPLELSVALPGEPVRVGIAWRVDDAEPGAVIVNRLTPASPADLAGIRAGDRIYRINGQPFASGDEFRELARTLADPLTLEVETQGKLRTIVLPRLDAAQEKTPADDAAAPPAGES